MHGDERRDPDLTRKMVLDEFVSDPEELHRKYYGLVERDRRARERASTESQLEKRNQELEREKEDLTRRLASAHGALDAYRKESRRLKDDLERVRGSRSMRIGRAITKPASVFRRGPDAGEQQGSGMMALPSPETASITGAASTDAAGSGSAGESSSAPKLWELTYEQLEERLQTEPRVDVLNALLNRAWFQRGDVTSCETMLTDHPDLVDELPDKGKELVARIHGESRLRDGRVTVPPRAHDAAYRVEHGRVMYCVHSTPIYDSNGYSTRTRGLVEGLEQSGVDVSVVSRIGYPWDIHRDAAPRQQERDVRELGGVEYVHLPGADLNRDPLDEYILKAADAYVREAKIRRPERIHAASNFRQALPALIAARRLGIPFVYEVRGLWELTEAVSKQGWEDSERFALQVELENIVATEADHVLAITVQVRDELIARGVEGPRITLAPNAVNDKEFVPLPADVEYARSIGVELDRPVIGFAGSLVAYEGLDVLLQAVRRIRDREIPVQVIIAGSGAASSDLRTLTAELGLEEDVTFLGRVPAQDIPRLMSIMDVMPCPRLSTRVTELVSPLKPLEALAAGKAVILSDVTPQADLVPEGSGRGFLVPAGDTEALAATLAAVLVDPELARAAARAGRLWVVRERTWNALSSGISSAYESASRHWDAALTDVPRRPLGSVRVGIVADEFTTETLGHRVQVVPISREDPLAALEQDLDAVLIESAWEGNGGEWFHGVGYYDDTQFAALRRLLWGAKQKGIPTLFWNKEDPIHYRRFVRAAVRCDHVFTTDASLVGRYLASGASTVRTASALPFYAEPTLHNPVQSPRALGRPSAMYAGTFYGERYAARSKELAGLLRAAAPYGLTIYDRQYDKPDSPYRFPDEFAPNVRGSLPYHEVLDAYRSHYVNLNVNSVADSPSMFSRRVVEVAASGGVVLSGPGRGVVETFGGAIPASADPSFHRALLRGWDNAPAQRFDEAWFQLRVIARSHTTETALAIMFRTVGIAVDGLRDPAYVAVLPDGSEQSLATALGQSTPPAAIAVPAQDAQAASALTELPVVPIEDSATWAGDNDAEALIELRGLASRTLAEDLLIAHRFRGDTRVGAREYAPGDDARLLAAPARELPLGDEHRRVGALTLLAGNGSEDDDGQAGGLMLVVPPTPVAQPDPSDPVEGIVREAADRGGDRLTVLVAGHDLKFLSPYIADLEAQGHTVLIDQWAGHSGHDEARSEELLDRADVVWCEWGLGNAVWYSEHLARSQKLIVRVHLQEIDLPYLRTIRMEAVDTFIFVGELIRRAAVEGHGVPEDRSVVVPNFVRTDALARPKRDGARHTLGLVGIVPQRKRLDLAIDLVERLHLADPRFRLRIKGRRPEEYPWMEKRPEEMRYYRELYERIDRLNAEAGEEIVIFDPHGDDMAAWYQDIGIVISTSDFESFHLTLADGAASGAEAVSLAWDGADLIYPDSMLFPDIESMADGLLDGPAREQRHADLAPVIASFDERRVFARFSELLFAGATR
ncbi:glycosyltransferase [Brachybacterium sp. UNK5269]|uniref:glycosyltransferase n=1 Tax=Brachybacterium sp. UNK5269 TaxID=3408576 RepID=UPI003BB07A9E